jgi:glutamine amidotransferase
MVSVGEALAATGADVRIVTRPRELAGTALVVVPGVGASGPAMRALRRRGLDVAIREALDGGATFLGICLGMQLLFERSEEDDAEGLGLMRGTVRSLPDAPRLPHIGWNQLVLTRPHPLTAGLADGTPAYFVHSFAPVPEDAESIIATTEHGGTFASAVASGRLLGVQFHPERSGADGLRLLANAVAFAAAATKD